MILKLIVEPISDPNWLADTKGSAYPGQFGEQSIVFYQAEQPTIGHFADRHGYFGASFHLSMPCVVLHEVGMGLLSNSKRECGRGFEGQWEGGIENPREC